MTVEYLIMHTCPAKAGQTVLFHAAAGGVGLIACQWLNHLGVEVIGTVGSAEKAELARAHGAAHTIDYRTEDFVERVKEITGGKGVPYVYDSVGKDTFMARSTVSRRSAPWQPSATLPARSIRSTRRFSARRARSMSPARPCSPTPRTAPGSKRWPATCLAWWRAAR